MQHYIVVGAGGTGSYLLPQLLTYVSAKHDHDREAYKVVVFDGDSFDRNNTERQHFDPALVAVNKATAMEMMYQTRYSIIGRNRFLGRADLDEVMQDGDIVFICADNFTVRAHINDRAKKLDDITVINGGNEFASGSVQVFIRNAGENVTPPLDFLHPEIAVRDGDDRSAMDCLTLANLPGGGQTLIANSTTATLMLQALWRIDNDMYTHDAISGWTEYQFDIIANEAYGIDQRQNRGWT